MFSNIKIAKPQVPIIPGTKLATRNAQLLVSTGIPSLDHFIGGGLPVGSILLIEEDFYNIHSKIIMKYFMAEGIVSTHPLYVASQDVSPSEILTDLPAVIKDDSKSEKSITNNDEQMKIAWRYQNMKIVNSSPGDEFGHYYDLTKKMGKEILDSAKTFFWNEEHIEKETMIFKNNDYMKLLIDIKKTIVNEKFLVSAASEKKSILRIAIHSLGSRMWLNDNEEEAQKDLLKFMYMLRSLLRESFAVAAISFPVQNYDNSTSVVERLEHLSDIVVSLESFAGSSKETNPVFKDYHGLLNIKKLAAFNTLTCQDILFTDLAYKLRRKKFLVEILHLPPEFGDTTQREQDDTANFTGCGGTLGKSKLDF